MTDLEGMEEIFNVDWTRFVKNELERSNERNSRNLGGRPTSTTSEDEETNQFDVNMDNIMKRFKCFNTIMQNNSSADEDEKDEDVEDVSSNEPDAESDKDSRSTLLQLDSNDVDTTAEDSKVDVVLPEVNEIDSKYADSGYWKVDLMEDELDDLLADYEWECSNRSWTARTMTLSAPNPYCVLGIFPLHACPLV